MTGPIMTPTGTPARARAAIASSRRSGRAARGSMRRASSGSSVVTEKRTWAAPCRASSAKRSASRATSADLVIAETGFRNSANTSRQRRVIPSRPSTGW